MNFLKSPILILFFAVLPAWEISASEYNHPSYDRILKAFNSTGGVVGSSYYKMNCAEILTKLSEEDQIKLIDLEAKIAQQGMRILKRNPIALEIHEAVLHCGALKATIEDQIKEKNYLAVQSPLEVLKNKVEMLTTHVENIMAVLKTDKKFARKLAEREKIAIKH